MLATIGLAVALGRTAPPDTGAGAPSRTEVLIGYDLAGPPTFARLLFDWRFDLIFGTAALVLRACVPARGAPAAPPRRRAGPPGARWPGSPGAPRCWSATSSGIGRYGPAMFSVHMGQHMILGMLVPILLVLGAPVTLALRALPPAGRDGPPGPREWLLAGGALARCARWLTHPLVTLPLFVGSYYALYFSGLFPAALPEHWAHQLMNLHFLLVGLLFFWPLVGVDPAPRRLPSGGPAGARVRLGAVPRVLRGGADERQHRDRRATSTAASPCPGCPTAARPAARRRPRLGRRASCRCSSW